MSRGGVQPAETVRNTAPGQYSTVQYGTVNSTGVYRQRRLFATLLLAVQMQLGNDLETFQVHSDCRAVLCSADIVELYILCMHGTFGK